MKRWPVMRVWSAQVGDERKELQTRELSGHQVCCLLGSAGLGKTWELNYLADLEREQGHLIRTSRLVELGASSDSLERSLDDLVSSTSAITSIYLDALDEAMVPIRTAGTILAAWVRRQLRKRAPQLRISCRSAVWQREISEALCEVYGTSSVCVASLRPLDTSDIRLIALDGGLDADAFMVAVDRARVHTPASRSKPLTCCAS